MLGRGQSEGLEGFLGGFWDGFEVPAVTGVGGAGGGQKGEKQRHGGLVLRKGGGGRENGGDETETGGRD